MRAAARDALDWLPDGSVVAGYAVEGQAEDQVGPERRYAVRGPDDSRATLVAARAPFPGRAARSRFARLAARRMTLDHPGAIPVRAAAERQSHGVLIADEYPERTLGDLLEEGAPLPPKRVVAMLAPVAEALDMAHGLGLVHQDLAAKSLLLSERDRLELDTFAILEGGGDPRWTTAKARDIRYVSPDVLRGEPLGAPGNVYSLAALIMHALTGAPPFSGDRAAIVYGHMSDPPPRLSERVPALGSRADAVMSRALAKEPSERPPSAAALVLELADALGVPAPDIVPPLARPPHPRPAPTRAAETSPVRERQGRRAIAVAAILVAVGAGAIAGAVAAPFGGDEPARATEPARPSVWPQVGERRAALRAELASARVPAEQARAASALADLFARAARAGGPGALRAASSETAIAYSRLAAAVRAHDRAAYADAAEAVRSADDGLSLAASRH
jgi:serine/threonine-protein kinase